MTISERKKELAEKEKLLLGIENKKASPENTNKKESKPSVAFYSKKYFWIGGIVIGLAVLLFIFLKYQTKKGKNGEKKERETPSQNHFITFANSEIGKTILSIFSTYLIDYLNKRQKKEEKNENITGSNID